jgi:hypothetical protein
MTTWTMVASLGSGALVGFLLSVFGGGGSVLATPLLLYLVGVRDAHVAIGTSAAAVAVNALFGLGGQARAGRVKWPCAAMFAVSGFAGSFIGATLAKRVPPGPLLALFGVAMAAVALAMWLPKRNEGDPLVSLNPRLALRLAPAGAATGLAAGFFGIGGGFLIAPALMAATDMTLASAAASSLLAVTVFGSATAASYALSGLVDWPIFLALVLGGAAGMAAGLPLASILAARAAMARKLFSGLILAVAVYVVFKALI